VIRRTRGVQRRRKGDKREEDEVQEKVKEASDSVHTGEKNSMPSDAGTGVGKSTVASVDGECRRARTNTPACAHTCARARTHTRAGRHGYSRPDGAAHASSPIQVTRAMKGTMIRGTGRA